MYQPTSLSLLLLSPEAFVDSFSISTRISASLAGNVFFLATETFVQLQMGATWMCEKVNNLNQWEKGNRGNLRRMPHSFTGTLVELNCNCLAFKCTFQGVFSLSCLYYSLELVFAYSGKIAFTKSLFQCLLCESVGLTVRGQEKWKQRKRQVGVPPYMLRDMDFTRRRGEVIKGFKEENSVKF